jgi:GNAT superfamily N-acetyltransferase
VLVTLRTVAVLELRPVTDQDLSDRRRQAVERVAHGRSVARLIDPDVAREQVDQLFTDTRERGWMFDVVDGDGVLGLVWLVQEGEELAVYDLHLDDPDRVSDLLPLLLEVARDRGVRRLGVGGRPYDPALVALVALPGSTARAFNMVLDLTRPIADPGDVELRPMTAVQFDAFIVAQGASYAETLVEAGLSPEAADERSRTQMEALLPSGLDSPGMEFFHGWVGDDLVGSLWLNVDQPMAFVYDVEVVEEQRRKGYGAAIMNAAALWSRDHGHPVLGLNVFAHNPGAKALYDKLGYLVTVDYRTFDVADA